MGDVNNEPAGLVKRMERTAAGCRWMVESWTRLRERLEPQDFWIPYHKFIAIRLMGRQPLDAWPIRWFPWSSRRATRFIRTGITRSLSFGANSRPMRWTTS